MKNTRKQTNAKAKQSVGSEKPVRRKTSVKKQAPPQDVHQQYLNQNIIINARDPSKIPIVHRKIVSAMNVRSGSMLSQDNRRTESVLGSISQSLQQRIMHQIDVDRLVTEEDVGLLADRIQYSDDEKESQCTALPNYKHSANRYTENEAALLIQKMWRGYKTRKLINYYINLFNRKRQVEQPPQHVPKTSLNQTKKYTKHGRKISDIVDMEKTQKIGSWQLRAEIQQSYTYRSETSPERVMEEISRDTVAIHLQKSTFTRREPASINDRIKKLRQEIVPNWNEVLAIINEAPGLDLPTRNRLLQLIVSVQKDGKRSGIYISQSESIVEEDVIKPQEMQVIENKKPTTDKNMDTYDLPSSESLIFDKPKIQNVDHPWIKVLQIRLKMIKKRERIELSQAQQRYMDGAINIEEYELRRERIIGRYLRQRKQALDYMEQINMGIEKCNEAIIKTKLDANFLYQVCGKDYSIRHSLSADSLISQFIKAKDLITQDEQLTDSVSLVIEDIIPLKTDSSAQEVSIIPSRYEDRTKTELQSPAKSEQHIQSIQKDDETLADCKKSVVQIQQYLEQILIQDVCRQIYLNDNIYRGYQPLIDLHHSYAFGRVTDSEIQQFLETIQKKFMPPMEILLTRLNQKINPTPNELLKILRNQEIICSQNEFYELVIPENSFKQFREWRQHEPTSKTVLSCGSTIWPLQVNITQKQRQKYRQRSANLRDKGKKLIKFQKDLQAMYYKSVFNCFNECIIDVKSSLSRLNGRSTIGPGQLRVSMEDSNIKVDETLIADIVSRAKVRVLDCVRYKCPALEVSNYLSLYRFQDMLTKQIKYEFNVTEYKWVSFFDEFLELAVEISRLVDIWLFEELEQQLNMVFKN